jgi:hypothetical protein
MFKQMILQNFNVSDQRVSLETEKKIYSIKVEKYSLVI